MPSPNSFPYSVTPADDQSLWFNESFGKMGRITTAGNITEYPTGAQGVGDVTRGPDGNAWFIHQGGVGRLTPAGVVTLFATFQSPGGGQITNGPDGNLWFTESGANSVGRITPQGTLTEFPLPRPSTQPLGITAGPDGRLWFTERGYSSLGSITMAGVVTEYPIPGFGWGITSGFDGRLWYGDTLINALVPVTTSGIVGPVVWLPSGADSALEVTSASDGRLWFSRPTSNVVGSYALDGTLRSFALPSSGSQVRRIVEGPDKNIWFTLQAVNKIGRGITDTLPVDLQSLTVE